MLKFYNPQEVFHQLAPEAFPVTAALRDKTGLRK